MSNVSRIFDKWKKLSDSKDKEKRLNMSLVPDDSWILLAQINKTRNSNAIFKDIKLAEVQVDKINSYLLNSLTAGLWLWIAEYLTNEPEVFNFGVLSFNLDKFKDDYGAVLDKWNALIDNGNKHISEEIEIVILAIYKLMEATLYDDDQIRVVLGDERTRMLLEELKLNLSRGYLLPYMFQYNG